MATPVHVAVGVILDTQLNILLTRRADDSHQGGLWEFPGGKVEAGESVEAALERELREELAIAPLRTQPLLEVHHDYGDKVVRLDVHAVWEFTGTPRGVEGQPMQWVGVDALESMPFPAANRPIVEAVKRLLGN